MSNDAIVLLKDDHKHIRTLFRDFDKAGPNATKTKAKIVDSILEALTVHTYIEKHHVADVLCMELAAMSADDERFDAKTSVLIENVDHHIDEEEKEWFPQVREALGRKKLQEIGEQMLDLKKRAPRSPAQPGALKKAVDAVLD